MRKIALLSVLSLVLIFSVQTFACTTFLISGKYTADGKPLLFKNRDSDQMQNALAFFNDGKYKCIGLVNGTADWNKEVWEVIMKRDLPSSIPQPTIIISAIPQS